MTRHYFQIPGVTFEKSWTLGPARFLSHADLMEALDPALTRAATTESMKVHQEVATEELAAWGDDAALEITAHKAEAADRLAQAAMSILRFYMRPAVRVNVEYHRI